MSSFSSPQILGRSISMTCDISVEDVFGPQVEGCLGDFDFTLLFEETILSIAPLAITLLLLPARIMHLRRQPQKVHGGGLVQQLKLVNTHLYDPIYLLSHPRQVRSRLYVSSL
jgi:hypothetical protein